MASFRSGVYIEFLKFNTADKLNAVTGDLIYFTGEHVTILAAGPAGTVLTSAGPGLAPTFAPAGGAVPDPLSINRINVNQLSNNTNPSGAIRFLTPSTLDYVDTKLAWGAGAAAAITTGANYTAIGASALAVNTTGSANTAVGTNSLNAIIGGDNNTGLGFNTGATLVSGSNNILIGQGANTLAAATAGATVIGQGASAPSSSIVLGQNATTATAGDIQIGQNALFSGTAVSRIRSQIISDEAWVGTPISYTQIDAAGNITKLISDNLPINGDVGENLTVNTTDATPTVMQTYATVVNSTRRITAKVVGHRTGGAAGNPNDTYSVTIDGLIKNNAGVVTAHVTTAVQIKDQLAWVVEYNISGTDAQLRVTGAVNNDITWTAWVLKF